MGIRGRARSLTVQFLMIRARSRAAFAASRGDFCTRSTYVSSRTWKRFGTPFVRRAGRGDVPENAPEIQLLKGMQ